jgi:hypothetical protein
LAVFLQLIVLMVLSSVRIVRPKAIWIEGNGEYASISDCPPGTTVCLFETWEDAEQAKSAIDCPGCGGSCLGKRGHSIVRLKAARSAGGLMPPV